MIELSVIILAKTDSAEAHRMTSDCIASLVRSEPNVTMEIIVVESNKNFASSNFVYPQSVVMIIPEPDFNFHKYLNIGIAASSGTFIALCNNDLIFQPGWFANIAEIAGKHRDIMSFSPSETPCSGGKRFKIGYKVMQDLKGWCIVVRKELFDRIGALDERFDFYYADNDYALTLRYHNIKHALVYGSHVIHLERMTEKRFLAAATDLSFVSKYRIPDYLKDPKYEWVFTREKYLSGIIKYHDKWGNPDFLYRKIKLADLLLRYRLGWMTRFFIRLRF